jgi:hypothetical protein
MDYEQMDPCGDAKFNCDGYGQQLWTFDDSYIIEKSNELFTKFDCVYDVDTTNLVMFICEVLL